MPKHIAKTTSTKLSRSPQTDNSAEAPKMSSQPKLTFSPNWRMMRGYTVNPDSGLYRVWEDVVRMTKAIWDESRSDIGLCKITTGEWWRWRTAICTDSYVVDLLKALDKVKVKLLSAIEEDAPESLYYSTLKAELRADGISAITISLLKPIIAAVVDSWYETSFSTVFRSAYQCFAFPSRFNLFLYEQGPETWLADNDRSRFSDDPYIFRAGGRKVEYSGAYMEFMFNNFVKFVENNDRLVGVTPPSPFIQQWFLDYLGEWLEFSNRPIPSEYFRFSGGATREFSRGTHELEKASFVAQHMDPYIISAIEDLSGEEWSHNEAFPCVEPASEPYDVSLVNAKLALVPKSYKAFRIITNEPTALVLYQQGLARSWREYYSCHSELSGRYTAERGPEVQRRKALEGSYHGRYATVDLSSASDSVSMTFFNTAFKHLPRTKQYLEMGRSKYVDPPDELQGLSCPIELNFFAGMGNPLTFNLEVAVFLAIGAEAISNCGGDFRHSILSVVGDDIIIEVKYYDELVRLLQEYGFIVNTDKSYSANRTHRFRESCGLHALDGCDVTPSTLPRDLEVWRNNTSLERRKRRMSTIWPVQAVAVANDLRSKGMRLARAEVIHILVERLDPMFLPKFCSVTEQDGIQSLMPTNFHLEVVGEEFVQNSKRFRRIWLNDINTEYRRYGRLTVSYLSQWDSTRCAMVPRENARRSRKRNKDRDDRHLVAESDQLPFELYWILRSRSDPDNRWLAAIGLPRNTTYEQLRPYLEEDQGPYPLSGRPRLWWEATIGVFPRL